MAKPDGTKYLEAKIEKALAATRQVYQAQRTADLALFEAFEALHASESYEAYRAYLEYMFFKFETTDRIRGISYEATLDLLKFAENMAAGVNFKNPEAVSTPPVK
jgi:hypothetical protein